MMKDDIKFYGDEEAGQNARSIALKDEIDSLQKLLAGQKEEDAELSGSVAHLEQENEEVAKENEELRKKLQNYLQQVSGRAG